MKKTRTLRLAAVALGAVGLFFLSACSTAEISDVWTAPDVTSIKFRKVLVIVVTPGSKDGASRRTAEDAIVHALPGLQAVPSYTFITEGDLLDAARSTAAIKSAGFDGVIVMRMVSVRTEVSALPAWNFPEPWWAFYGGYGYGRYGYYPRYGYGRYGYGGYYGNGYGYGGLGPTVTTDHIYLIETNIYEFPSEKLLWSGVVESTSPRTVKRMVDDAVGAILQSMAKQKLIPAPVQP